MTNAMRRTTLTLSLLVLALSLASFAAVHPPVGRSSPKRHASTSSDTKKPLPRRSHPYPDSGSSRSSLFSRAVEAGAKLLTQSTRAKKPKRLGPGPGYKASLAALQRSGYLDARGQRQKRQVNSTSTTSASGATTTTTISPFSTSTSGNDAPVWLLEDTYSGKQFFDYFTFYNYKDPTNGLVEYVDKNTAIANNLAYIRSDNKIIMKADNTTVLSPGQNRKSVRIETDKSYTGGLFLLDLDRGPYGCGVWPAWWSTNANWPYQGEIDIYEGVHMSTNNQIAWHTGNGCTLKVPGGFRGTANSTNCYALVNNNEGCAITDQSYSSSGETLRNIGGGIFAMKWDKGGISVWFFPRAVIPDDILANVPDPTQWGVPTAHLSPDDCDIVRHFQDHKIIFNITFCGDWAGMTYLNSGCPGTCNEQIQNPANLNEAIWVINSLRVYTNSDIQAGVLSVADPRWSSQGLLTKLGLGLAVSAAVTIMGWL